MQLPWCKELLLRYVLHRLTLLDVCRQGQHRVYGRTCCVLLLVMSVSVTRTKLVSYIQLSKHILIVNHNILEAPPPCASLYVVSWQCRYGSILPPKLAQPSSALCSAGHSIHARHVLPTCWCACYRHTTTPGWGLPPLCRALQTRT